MKYKHSFTIIELLVVIAIISILASLLVPALGRAKANAKMLHCISNLKQLNMGMQYYSLDFKGFPPSTVGDWSSGYLYWRQIFGDYIKNNYSMSMRSIHRGQWLESDVYCQVANEYKDGNLYRMNYNINHFLTNFPSPNFSKAQRNANASMLVLFNDGWDNWHGTSNPYNSWSNFTDPANPTSKLKMLGRIHPDEMGGSTNFTFWDGHAKNVLFKGSANGYKSENDSGLHWKLNN